MNRRQGIMTVIIFSAIVIFEYFIIKTLWMQFFSKDITENSINLVFFLILSATSVIFSAGAYLSNSKPKKKEEKQTQKKPPKKTEVDEIEEKMFSVLGTNKDLFTETDTDEGNESPETEETQTPLVKEKLEDGQDELERAKRIVEIARLKKLAKMIENDEVQFTITEEDKKKYGVQVREKQPSPVKQEVPSATPIVVKNQVDQNRRLLEPLTEDDLENLGKTHMLNVSKERRQN